MKPWTVKYVLPFCLMVFFVSSALAAPRTTTQSGNWSAAGTWGGNPAPVAGDDVVINAGFAVTVDVANAACTTLQLGGSLPGTGTGAITFAAGSKLTVAGAVSIGPEGSNNTAGSLNMAAGGTLICEGFTLGRLGTWTGGTGTIELTASNTIPTDTSIIFNNLTISGGTTLLPRNVDVLGNILINAGGSLDGGINTLTVGGNWTNNGTFTGNAGTVRFARNGNATISGTGLNNFNLLRVDLGTSFSNVLEVVATNFSAPDGFLTLVNGTLKVSGTFPLASTFVAGPIYNIAPTAGLWLNNPNVTVTAQAGTLSVRGLLRLTAGTYNVGTGVDNSLTYMTGSVITIEGGALHVAGQITRNNATATTAYTQSGGTVTLVEQGSTNASFGAFDLGAVGSTFTTSGGTIIIRNATSGPADFVNASSSATVTGGTLQVGDAATANAQVIRLQTSRAIGNLVISNATAQATKPTVQILTSSLNVAGNVTIQAGTTLNAGGLNVSLGGNWSNSGSFTSGNTVTFNGAVAQTASGFSFNNLTINNPAGVNMLSDGTVGSTLSLASGALSIGAHTLNVNGAIATAAGALTGGPASNLVVGGAGAGTTVPGVTLNTFTLGRAAGATLGGDLTVSGLATITAGTLDTGANAVVLAAGGSLVEPVGQPVAGNVRATRNITATSGTESFGNIGADIVLNGVAPGLTTVTRRTGTASSGAGHNSITRWFDISPATNTGLGANLVFHYDPSEVGGQTAGSFELYRSRDGGATWNNLGGAANIGAGTVTATGLGDFSRWTVADAANALGNTAAPTTTSLSPASRLIGDAAFTLTVNGTEFVSGKSTVRFNGADRPTTFVSSRQLTAAIPAGDLVALGAFPVTVFTAGGGGLSNAQNLTVGALPAVSVRVETAADGSGVVVPAQSLAGGASITTYAISRNALGQFVANVVAGTWSLVGTTGRVVAADLVPAPDGRSAVFTGHAPGATSVRATSGALTTTPSGLLTVTYVSGVDQPALPRVDALNQNFPNPYNPKTVISYDITAAGRVSLKVYNLRGEVVATVVDAVQPAGRYAVDFDGAQLPSGTYFYRIQAGGFVETRKMTLMK